MASGTIKLPAGLELAYDLEKSAVQNGLDAFVLALHWSVVRTGLLQRSETNELTERLPTDWSQHTATPAVGASRTFSLFYYDKHNSRIKYELKVIELTPNDMVAVTFFRTSSQEDGGGSNSSSTNGGEQSASTAAATVNRPGSNARSGAESNSAAATFQIGNFVNLQSFRGEGAEGSRRDRAADVYSNADQLETQFYGAIMEPLGLKVTGQPPVLGPYDDKSKTKSSNSDTGRGREPFTVEDRYPDIGRRPSPLSPVMPLGPLYVPPLAGGPGPLGRSDLDPLGRFGAGNILDPRGFRSPRLGGVGALPGLPGGIPPGVRFDPFGPPNPSRPDGGAGAFGLPNPDRDRPPSSDYDDMFM